MIDNPQMMKIQRMLAENNKAFIMHAELLRTQKNVHSSLYNHINFHNQFMDEKKHVEEMEEAYESSSQFSSEYDDDYDAEPTPLQQQGQMIQEVINGSGKAKNDREPKVNPNIEKIKNMILEEARKGVNKGGELGMTKYEKKKSTKGCDCGGAKPAIIEIRDQAKEAVGSGAKKRGRKPKAEVTLTKKGGSLDNVRPIGGSKRGRKPKVGGMANINGMHGVGPSGLLASTAINQFANVPKIEGAGDEEPFIPPIEKMPSSLALGEEDRKKKEKEEKEAKKQERESKRQEKEAKRQEKEARKKLRGGVKRAPSAWNVFVSDTRKKMGGSMKDVLKYIKDNGLWKKK